jgi:hypothetical protein
MDNFIQKQIELSERLYKIMLADHKSRFEKIAEAYALSESLQKKLDERDEEIKKLKREIQTYEAFARM